jgi:hypothetical protein
MTNPAHLSGPRHLDNFIVTPNARPSIGTLQKLMPTLTRTATQLNRRAVSIQVEPVLRDNLLILKQKVNNIDLRKFDEQT